MNVSGLDALELVKTARVEIVHRQVRMGEVRKRVPAKPAPAFAGWLPRRWRRHRAKGLALLVDRLERATQRARRDRIRIR